MSGKTLLANLLVTCGLSSAAAATAGAVASGKPGMSTEDQAAGTESLEKLVEAAHAEGKTAGIAEGRKAERERFGAVLTGEECDGRMGLAITLLSTTDLTADAVNTSLKAAAKEPAAAAPAAAPAAPPAGQSAAEDPIARTTPTVDTGRSTTEEQANEAASASLWKGAIDSVTGGITEGGVWGNMGLTAQPHSAN